jgi:hypothetical protein
MAPETRIVGAADSTQELGDETMVGVGVSGTTSEELRELVEVGTGPARQECLAVPPSLSPALEAIQSLGERAASDEEYREALFLVFQKTYWRETSERSFELLLEFATADLLERLGRHLFDEFWQPGEYGGGEVTRERLSRTANRLAELGGNLRELFPEDDRDRIDWMLGVWTPRKPK